MLQNNKYSGQAYISSTIRSARLSVQRNRYAQTAYTNFSISTKNNNNGGQRQKIVSINDQILNNRKNNHLQTQANKRAVVLKKIQKDNDRLFKRINSQKSLYSQESLKKSNVSIKSLSRCSSRSSSKRNSSTIKKNNVQKKNRKNQQRIKLQQGDVEKVHKKQIEEFKNIFMGIKLKQDEQKSSKTKQNKDINEMKYNIRQIKLSTSFNIRRQPKLDINHKSHNLGLNMGNMLHRIAQEFHQPKMGKSNKQKQKTYLK